MSIKSSCFGKMPDGKEIKIYSLSNSSGMTVKVINYGGTIVSVVIPDKNGHLNDVVLGYDTLDGYLHQNKYFGAIIGRHANRIEDGVFEINGVKYNVSKNDHNNHLHGGKYGFDKVVWDAEVINNSGIECLKLNYLSVDGEENYPGNLDVKVLYTLTEDNEIKIEYFATTDKDTLINLTNHSYFNLSDHSYGDISHHELMIYSDKFTVINEEGIPTGEIRNVKGTPMNFKILIPIGLGFQSDHEQIKAGGGYDHNWVLNGGGKNPEKAAELYDPKTGRVMEVYTTCPGIQFYSGNFLDGSDVGKEGAVYNKRSGLCLETQYFPNATKHKHFPSPILKTGEMYNQTTIYKFSTRL